MNTEAAISFNWKTTTAERDLKMPRLRGRGLSRTDSLALVLMRLPRGLDFRVLADFFGSSVSTVHNDFVHFATVLSHCLSYEMTWPDETTRDHNIQLFGQRCEWSVFAAM